MSIEITLLVLLAAMLNAGWNAVIKVVSGDRIAVMAVVTMFGSLISMLTLPFIDLPDPASWPLRRPAKAVGHGPHRARLAGLQAVRRLGALTSQQIAAGRHAALPTKSDMLSKTMRGERVETLVDQRSNVPACATHPWGRARPCHS